MSHHYIKFSNVSYTYPDATKALDDVSLMISHGERVALLGLNGSGKSTLLLQMNGLLLPSSGEVNVGDVPVTEKTASIVRRTVGMVFQNPDDMLFMPTVYDDVAFGPRNMQLPENEVACRVENSLSAVGLENQAGKASFQLSGGQRRCAAVASVLSMEPDILVLDEPSANLDPLARRNLLRILSSFTHTIVLATHDFELAKKLCPRSILLEEGKVIADGETEKVIEIFENKIL
ncbi:MAG: energy-coupling factor ABC transporter ATP-binding protein [Muribaculaceae bacterium]|nr:energy-coupling factor ABC transporter ATP-binding protein [Muribaculaceae bacterium]